MAKLKNQEIMIADASLEQLDVLLQGLDASVQVQRVQDPQQAKTLIAQALDDPQTQRLHLLGHGQPGSINLGGEWLDSDAFKTQTNVKREQLLEINFWSCCTGAETKGKQFMEMVAKMATAKVNASTTKVGHEEMGGNWELDVMTMPTVPFSQEARAEFRSVLVDTNVYYDCTKSGTGGTGTSGNPYTSSQVTTLLGVADVGTSGKQIAIKAGTLTLTAGQATGKYIIPAAGITSDVLVVTGLAAGTDLSHVSVTTVTVTITSSVDITLNPNLSSVDTYQVGANKTLTMSAAEANGKTISGSGNVVIEDIAHDTNLGGLSSDIKATAHFITGSVVDVSGWTNLGNIDTYKVESDINLTLSDAEANGKAVTGTGDVRV